MTEARGQFKAKAATSTWSTIREGFFKPSDDPYNQPYVRSPTPEAPDEAPVVVGSSADLAPPSANHPPPATGGLQTPAQLRAERERREVIEAQKAIEAKQALALLRQEQIERGEDPDEADDPTATVYRDASGQRIDVKLEKAERARLERERVEREMKKMEWGKGLVQREDKEVRKREEARLAAKPLARYADDEDMNDELRDQERWNDPAAAFLTVSYSHGALSLSQGFADCCRVCVGRRRRRSRGRARQGSRATLARRHRRTGSGSRRGTGGTGWTGAMGGRPR